MPFARHYFRFRLRTRLVVMTLAALMMPWGARKYHDWRWEPLSGDGRVDTSGWATMGCYLSFDDDNSDAPAAE